MENKKRFYYLLFGLIIGICSYAYLIYQYDWKVFISIFGIVWSNNIAKSKTFKNR